MVDDVLINKAAVIERCVARAKEEYLADPEGFATNFTRQDAAILNMFSPTILSGGFDLKSSGF